MNWSQHLILLPILLPMLSGAVLIMINESRHQLKFCINMASVVATLAAAIGLLWMTDSGYWADGINVYLAGNWTAPFGIILLIDRLSALMVLLTALLATLALLYSMLRWSRIGVHFHSMFQFLLMGINGAFLTHDLFNLFVFFEVMLAASYGLLLHGYNLKRLRAGMQFVVINLVASLLFLIGIALIYGAVGTLNMSDLALRLKDVGGDELVLFKIGGSILALAFLIKSAMWPLGFWLPTTYAAASPPVAAMLALMTKVGIYVLLRLGLLTLGDDSAASGFGLTVLFWGGVITIIFGAAGMVATDDYGRLAGYAAIISSGTLLAAIGLGQPSLIAAVLYYLVSSTLAIAALMLLIELIERCRNPIDAMLAITMEAFGFEETPEQPVGVGIPAALALLALSFFACALVITGLPPLSGFVAKFTLFHSLLGISASDGGVVSTHILLMGLLLLAGMAAIIALMRNGVRTFWASDAVPARLQLTEFLPIAILLGLCLLLTILAQPVMSYMDRASASLHQPDLYIERVMTAPVVPGVVHATEAISGGKTP